MPPTTNWALLLTSHFVHSWDSHGLLSQDPRSYGRLVVITILLGDFLVFWETEGRLDGGIWGEDC